VKGLAGEAVCQAVTEICASDASPIIDGPKECSMTIESRQPSRCELERSCVQSVKYRGAVDATITTRNAVSCSDDGTGSASCSCARGGQLRVNGQDGTTACDATLEICARDSPIDFDGEAACTPSDQSGGTGFCGANQTCNRSAELGNGVLAIENEQREVTCQSAAAGGSNCTCTTEHGTWHFDLESATNDDGNCARYVPLCGDFDSLELSGEIRCAPNAKVVDEEYCFVEIVCKQRAAIGGERIMAQGSVFAECNRAGDAYACTCNTLNDSAEIEVQASTAWDAGTLAAAECPNAVTVAIGASIE
jgi:hypothetical protein